VEIIGIILGVFVIIRVLQTPWGRGLAYSLRHVIRTLIYATVAVVVLAGVGLTVVMYNVVQETNHNKAVKAKSDAEFDEWFAKRKAAFNCPDPNNWPAAIPENDIYRGKAVIYGCPDRNFKR